MARIFPKDPDKAAPHSERRLFEILRDRLNGDFIVFHGQRINAGHSAAEGLDEHEVDFIVFHPFYGYLVLEVKGGGIHHDEEGWWSEGGDGAVHRIKDPGRQAQGQVRALNRFLRENAVAYQKQTPHYGWGVCFPDVSVGSLQTPELPRERILDATGLREENLEASIFSLFQKVGATRRTNPYDPEVFKRAIAPKLHLVPRLASKFEEEEVDLVKLTEEQSRILDFMDANPVVVIRGGAGTGKTMIALERARRMAAAGDRVLLLCYSEPLAHHLRRQIEGVKVTTFNALSRELVQKAGLTFQVPADIERQRVFWSQGVAYLLEQATRLLPEERWDHIIIDEGQDFLLEWWTGILDLRRDESSSLWVFFDPNQKVFTGQDLSQDLQAVRGNLAINCRNTRRIAERLAELVPDCAKTRPDAPEGENVVSIRVAEPNEMIEEVRKVLHSLLVEGGVDPERTVILSPRLPETSDIWNRRTFGNWNLRLLEDDPQPNTVRFSSLHRFKGLEADAVVLCEVRYGAPGCTPINLYVASSRAKHILYECSYEPPGNGAKAAV